MNILFFIAATDQPAKFTEIENPEKISAEEVDMESSVTKVEIK